MGSKCLIIGLSGATCSGKTTLANALHKLIKNSVALNQDEYYWDEKSEKHILSDGVGHINWELVTAFDNDKMIGDIKSHTANIPRSSIEEIKADSIIKKLIGLTDEIGASQEKCAFFDSEHGGGNLVQQLKTLFSFFPKLVILDGILIFNHPELLKVCDLKFFMTLDHKTCSERRSMRSYDPPDIPGYFEKIVYPYYVKNLEAMKMLDTNNDIIYLDGANDILENFKSIMIKCTNFLK